MTAQPAPRPIRNNNPLDLRDSGIAWEGLVGSDGGGLCIFATPEAGLRAGVKDVFNQPRLHGLKTVAAIVEKFAPPNENNTPAYIAFVAKTMGVAADAVLDLRQAGTLETMIGAMLRMEDGAEGPADYPADMIATVCAEVIAAAA